jgi:hypothetical protein
MLTQVPMDAKLARSLQQVAAERGASVEEVMNDLARQYLRQARHVELTAEMERYRAQHATLLEKYRGEYLGLRNGQVLDHDQDGGKLYLRLRAKYGGIPILIVEVTDTPEQEFTVRNPKLEFDV